MKVIFKVILFCFTIMFFSMTVSWRAIAADEQQWVRVPEENYAEILELVVLCTKTNYEGISFWQGKMNIHEEIHFWGADAAEKSHAVDTNSIAKGSKHICEIGNVLSDFAIDMRNNKIYSSVEPDVQYKAIDLGQYVPIRKKVSVPKVKTILSPDYHIWFMPDEKFSQKARSLRAQKTVFIESSENENVKSFVREPREFFNSGGENVKLWDTLLKIRGRIDDRIKERIAGYPHIEISSLETDKGVKYRIITTWKGGENYEIKYIRYYLEVDEAVSFNATKTERINSDGIKTTSNEYTYEKIGEIYVPKTIKKEQYNPKGEPVFTSEITIETTGLNKQLPEDTFTIKNLGLEDGTLVSDKIKKAEFRYSNSGLVPVSELDNLP